MNKFNEVSSVINTIVLIGIIKQILHIERKLLKIPTGGKLTSRLFTQGSGGVELGTTENKPR